MLKTEKLIPDDGYCMICILNQDIYNKDDWLFVFGVGGIRERTGVFSFARLDPKFENPFHTYSEEEVKDLISYRSIKVMIHEIGHMFGMLHWVYYQCVMNGYMSAEEGHKRPCHLCPICLRKLWHNIGFDPLERFKAISKACEVNPNFNKEKEWYDGMIEHLEEVYKTKKLDKPIVKRFLKKEPGK